MAITNSGFTLIEDNDTQASWSGTDGISAYNISIEENGTANSEEWNVAKNTTEQGNLTFASSVNISSQRVITVWVKSDLAQYYTNIEIAVDDGTRNLSLPTFFDTVSSSTAEYMTEVFRPMVYELTASDKTITPITNLAINFNNSSSGNIRSIINTWVDKILVGARRVISGTTTNNKLFKESNDIDTSTGTYDGVSQEYFGGLVYNWDIEIAGTCTSENEVVKFVRHLATRGSNSTYANRNIFVSGTLTCENTTFLVEDLRLLLSSNQGIGCSLNFIMESATACNITNCLLPLSSSYDAENATSRSIKAIAPLKFVGCTFEAVHEYYVDGATYEDCTFLSMLGNGPQQVNFPNGCLTVEATTTGPIFKNCTFNVDTSAIHVDLTDVGSAAVTTPVNIFEDCTFNYVGTPSLDCLVVFHCTVDNQSVLWSNNTLNNFPASFATNSANATIATRGNTSFDFFVYSYGDEPTIDTGGLLTTTVIHNLRTYTLTGILQNSRVYIERTDTQVELVNELVTASGEVSYEYEHAADIPIKVHVRYAAGLYRPNDFTDTLANNDKTVTVTQVQD